MTVEATMTIDGKPVTGSDWISVPNPAHKSTTVGRFPNATAEHVNLAVQSAKDALPGWQAIPATERAALLIQVGAMIGERFNEWVPLLTSENGKILSESAMDFLMASVVYQTWGAHPEWMDDEEINDGRRLIIRKEPMGVCAGIVPWNFPQALSALQISTALFAGNTIVVKVPEFGPLAMLQSLAEVAAMFPPGVLNLVSGFGPQAGRALVQHPDIRKIAFTGSSATGKTVMADAAGHLARLTLELGGNDAAIILEDAEINEETIKRLIAGAFTHTGQICFAIKRLYVHESHYQAVTDGLRAAVDQIIVGDGMRPEVTMGPINNARQYEKVCGILAETKTDLNVVELGSYAEGTEVDNGYFMRPHLVFDPPDASTIVSCEQMGPILPIMKFRDEDEVVARANDSEYGLASSVWSSNESHAFEVGARIQAGTTFINSHSMLSVDLDAPFGGMKESGIGYGGTEVGLAGYVQLHVITNNYMG